ncbi:MAG: hypothetical protein DSZ03_06740 [Sulfurimonas sp.]|nr:MAG: hypothetical protein DSZ03_06740 [Sulfurimonas sp.]
MKFTAMIVAATLLISGCSGITDVKPWEKERLSRDTMKNTAGNTLMSKFDAHVYFSKEATKGGGGVAGGGCGCN